MLLYVMMGLGGTAGAIQMLKPKNRYGRTQPALNRKRR